MVCVWWYGGFLVVLLERVPWPRTTYRLGGGRLLITERELHGYEPETTSIILRLYMCVYLLLVPMTVFAPPCLLSNFLGRQGEKNN